MNQEFYFVINEKMKYPEFPYNSSQEYLEFNNFGKIFELDNYPNYVYESIRNLFIQAKYDKENLDTKGWNPFRGLIYDGQRVVIKPNFVKEKNNDNDTDCITTHLSVIRPIIDYLILLKKQDNLKFEITICDVPLQSTDMNKLLSQNRLTELLEYYKDGRKS